MIKKPGSRWAGFANFLGFTSPALLPLKSFSRSSLLCRQQKNGSLLEKDPLFTHFCTKMKISSASFHFMGDLDQKGPSCELLMSHHLNRPESHQRSRCDFKPVVWKFSSFAETGKRRCSFNSPRFIPYVKLLK